MAERLPLTLHGYRLLASVAGLFAPTFVARRLKRGKEHPERFRERYGDSKIARPAGPLVWVHAASVGELLAVIPLIDRIRERDFNVLCTSGTVTSAALAEQRLPAGCDPPVRDARRAAFRQAVPQPLAARSRAVRRIGTVAQPHHHGGRARRAAHPGERADFGARVQPLAPRAGQHRGAAAVLRALPGAVGDLCGPLARSRRAARRHHRQPQARRAGAARRSRESARSCAPRSAAAR